MNVVLDTNVLVSALWSADSKPAAIVTAVIAGKHTACYDYRILEAYTKVLHRPKFGFSAWQVDWLMESIEKNGISVMPDPLPDLVFPDEDDCKFLEAAKFCFAPLITGNVRHFPADPAVITVADFYENHIL